MFFCPPILLVQLFVPFVDTVNHFLLLDKLLNESFIGIFPFVLRCSVFATQYYSCSWLVIFLRSLLSDGFSFSILLTADLRSSFCIRSVSKTFLSSSFIVVLYLLLLMDLYHFALKLFLCYTKIILLKIHTLSEVAVFLATFYLWHLSAVILFGIIFSHCHKFYGRKVFCTRYRLRDLSQCFVC